MTELETLNVIIIVLWHASKGPQTRVRISTNNVAMRDGPGGQRYPVCQVQLPRDV